ncbi:MAG: prolipoprotein diacylglyceryl transferase [Bacteroidetes bacterium]|nr:prolipoprotein diacylglyceryl transferase [Bacteroidota bacterium]
MYPDFYHLLKGLFGIDIPVLGLFKTFGFLVAIAFFVGGYLIYKELKRKEDDGIVDYTIEEITTGKPLSLQDYILSGLGGFFIGFKVLGMLLQWKIASPDPLSFIFSIQGNLPGGIFLGATLVAFRYWENKKEVAKGLITKKVKTYPHIRVGDILVIAALGGFAGAKIFNALETWDDFVRDPLGSLFSSSGLTFYGGLIVATFALWYYSRKIKLDFRHLCDAAAPALILAYGIGRLGCQISGDGDWGIYNSAYYTDSLGKVVESSDKMMESNTIRYADYFERHKEEGIQHKYIKANSFLPTWFFAYNYPHNVNNVGVPLANCDGEYCSVLPQPVFPTPVYEFIVSLLIFAFLWAIRKKLSIPLSIFSIYLIMNGIERFFIEQIRVNYKYDWGFMHPTQAEILAVVIILCGVILFSLRGYIHNQVNKASSI